MSNKRPRSLLDPDDVGVLILPGLPRELTDMLNTLRASRIDCFDIENVNQRAWSNPELWELMETPKWRQLLIIAPDLDTYEIGLATMALEKGFNVFFASQKLGENYAGVARLRQASVIVTTLQQAIDEVELT